MQKRFLYIYEMALRHCGKMTENAIHCNLIKQNSDEMKQDA